MKHKYNELKAVITRKTAGMIEREVGVTDISDTLAYALEKEIKVSSAADALKMTLQLYKISRVHLGLRGKEQKIFEDIVLHEGVSTVYKLLQDNFLYRKYRLNDFKKLFKLFKVEASDDLDTVIKFIKMKSIDIETLTVEEALSLLLGEERAFFEYIHNEVENIDTDGLVVLCKYKDEQIKKTAIKSWLKDNEEIRRDKVYSLITSKRWLTDNPREFRDPLRVRTTVEAYLSVDISGTDSKEYLERAASRIVREVYTK